MCEVYVCAFDDKRQDKEFLEEKKIGKGEYSSKK